MLQTQTTIDPSTRATWTRWITPLTVTFVLAAILRLLLIPQQGLWADEIFSLAIATGHSLEHPADVADPSLGDYTETSGTVRPSSFERYTLHDSPPASPGRVLRATFLSDTSPPGYYLLLWAWSIPFGTSDWSLRLFSLVLGMACFPLIAALARQIGRRDAVLPACVLFGFAPVSVFFSTEGRMYSLMWFLVLLLAWATLRVHRSGWRSGMFVLWVLSAAAGLLTHYFFVFPLMACGVWLLIYPWRLGRPAVVAAGVMAAALVAPWYVRLPESLANWRVTQEWLYWQPYEYLPLKATLRLMWSFFTSRGPWGGTYRQDLLAVAVVGLLALLTCKLALNTLVMKRTRLLWLWLLAAWFGPVLFDLIKGTYVVAVHRYAITGFPAAILLLSVLLARTPKPLRYAFVLALVIAWLPGYRQVFAPTARSWSEFRETAAVLDRIAKPGDVVILHGIPSGVIGVTRYMERDDVPVMSWTGQLAQRRVPDDVLPLIRDHQRIIVAKAHPVGAAALQEQWLARHYRMVEEIEGATMDVEVYDLNQPPAPTTPATRPATQPVIVR